MPETQPATTFSVAITAAPRWYPVLLVSTCLLAGLGIACAIVAALLPLTPFAASAPTVALIAAGLLVPVGGLGPAVLLASGRRRVIEAADVVALARRQREAMESARAEQQDAPKALFSSTGADAELVFAAEQERLIRLSGWPQMVVGLPPLLVAIVMCWFGWPQALAVPGGFGIGIACLIIVFPVLLLERRLSVAAAASVAELPEAMGLTRLVRVALWTLLAVGAAEMARSADIGFVIWILYVLAGLIAVAACEAMMRLLAAPFLPAAQLDEARGLADAALSGLALPRLGAGGTALAGLKERFGIDIAQSWALRFVTRASGPITLGMLVIAWLLTGITMLSVHERGIYERGGKPVAVWTSGMHVHLPWPFGSVRRIDAGAIHQITLGGDDEQALPKVSADAIVGSEFDRLWNTTHVADAMYVVPGNSRSDSDIDAAQLLGGDVRIYYRIGTSDAQAIAAAYRLANPQDTVRTLARSALTHLFASRTVLAAIGEDREKMATIMRTTVQERLDRDETGLEITAVTIDSIHPPVGAAVSYHRVQEAEIASAIEIASAKRSQTESLSNREVEAITSRASATWLAAQKVSDARAQATRFAADAAAWKEAGHVLAFERWLSALEKNMNILQKTIIDHRLQLQDGPVIDLRKFSSSGASPAAPAEDH